MTEKRYRTEQIEGATLPFIVDNYSAKKHNKMTCYKAYDTTTVKKCDELTDLLNNYEDENEQLKADNNRLVNETARIVAEHQGRVLDLIDDKIVFVNACEEISRIPKEDYYRGALEILELLKKELQE